MPEEVKLPKISCTAFFFMAKLLYQVFKMLTLLNSNPRAYTHNWHWSYQEKSCGKEKGIFSITTRVKKEKNPRTQWERQSQIIIIIIITKC